MYFLEKIKNLSKDNKVQIYVDMDGVIADYDFGNKLELLTKRPIMTNINTLKEINNLANVSLYILSVGRKNKDIIDKNMWLDKYVPFIKKENRIIISKEGKDKTSKELKLEYLKKVKTKDLVVVIDDDNAILKFLMANLSNIIYFQDSSIID